MVCPVFRKNLDYFASMVKEEVPSFSFSLYFVQETII